jgi:phosphoenolpyruvate synthase/pyruvate phosphate dikinase
MFAGVPAGSEYVRLLDGVSPGDARLVGVSGSNIAKLRMKGLPVSDGFVVTTRAFEAFARSCRLEKSVKWLSEHAKADDAMERDRYARMVETIMQSSRIPDEVKEAILVQYWELCGRSGSPAVLARCSFPVEVSSDPSFMWRHSTFFDLSSEQELLAAVKRCWASIFNPLAIRLWSQRLLGANLIPCAVVVQEQGPVGPERARARNRFGGREGDPGEVASIRALIGDLLPASDHDEY